jgi:hypothetical protein
MKKTFVERRTQMEQPKADEDDELYFTDLEYLQLLESKRRELDKVTKIVAVDSTELGNKYTESNVGICETKKYLKENHKCPLDNRRGPCDYSYGCFYFCAIFEAKKSPSIEKIKIRYDRRIHEFKKVMNARNGNAGNIETQ